MFTCSHLQLILNVFALGVLYVVAADCQVKQQIGLSGLYSLFKFFIIFPSFPNIHLMPI